MQLLNDALVYELAGQFAERIERQAGDDLDQQISRVYSIALGRQPASEEAAAARETLVELKQQWLAKLQDQADCEPQATHRALTNLCHAIMNSAAFSMWISWTAHAMLSMNPLNKTNTLDLA